VSPWRTFGAALIAAVMTGVLAGCGGGGGGSGGDSPPPAAADVEVALSASAASVMEGDDVTYSFTLRSIGTDTARDVVLTLDLGSGQALAGVNCAASGGGRCPAQLGARMVVPALPPGAQLAFTAPATVSLGAPVSGVRAIVTAQAAADARAANNSATVSVGARERSFVRLQSDTGDPIGQGAAYGYTKANAQISVSASGGLVTVQVRGDQQWNGYFQLPNSLTQFQVGTYPSLTRYPFHSAAVGGMLWDGPGSCGQLRGAFTVTRAIYVAGALSELDLTFEQTCESSTGALRGELRWRSGDTSQPPGPVSPPPATLWQPPAGATPASGDYVYLESDNGDFIGAGVTRTYTRANATLAIAMVGQVLQADVAGDQQWRGAFSPMIGVTLLAPGYYPNAQQQSSGNPARPGMNWSGDGRGCGRLQGWFVVDRVAFVGGQLRELELRFEQRCDNAAGVLRGKLRLTGSDTTVPPGPVQPPPAGLWAPPAGVVPTSGDFIYLQSDAADFVGGGRAYSYTRANAQLRFDSSAGQLSVTIEGDEWWNGDFKAMDTLARLEPGYYGELQRFPFHNRVRGGLSWVGEGRGCNQSTGWFVVDSVTYSGNTLTALTLRFEQRCENGAAALRGMVRLMPGDTTTPPGPVNPPPAGLWAPPAGVTPASGDYVYLESNSGDYIGAGATFTYTRANALLSFSSSGARLAVAVTGDQSWRGAFLAMSSLARLQPGYYGDLQREPFSNPTKGGLEWSGEGRGCNQLNGWFVVDSVTYNGNALAAIELRFEQRCEGAAAALRGKVRLTPDDTAQPPGPVNPPPAGLWSPPAGAVPASGNVVYLQSQAGDFIGGGRTMLYTDANARLTFADLGSQLSVTVNGDTWWYGQFQSMVSLTRLEPGYYGDVQRWPFHNPIKGGLSWSGDGRGCNRLGGWFVVDEAVYDSGGLVTVALRFVQRCEGGSAELRGYVRWSR